MLFSIFLMYKIIQFFQFLTCFTTSSPLTTECFKKNCTPVISMICTTVNMLEGCGIFLFSILLYKKLIKARVTDYWERYYRAKALHLCDHSLKHFKPEFMSLSWPHKIWTTCGSNPFEIHKAVVQARMLSGRFITDKLSRHWNQNRLGLCTIPGCTGDETGSLEHYLLFCPALGSARANAMKLFHKVSLKHEVLRNILQNIFQHQTSENIVQFLLDCSSVPEIVTLSQSENSSLVDKLFYISQTWCYSIHRSRMNRLGLFQYR